MIKMKKILNHNNFKHYLLLKNLTVTSIANIPPSQIKPLIKLMNSQDFDSMLKYVYEMAHYLHDALSYLHQNYILLDGIDDVLVELFSTELKKKYNSHPNT